MGSTKIGGGQEWEPPGEAERLSISQHKEGHDLPNIRDTIKGRCQTSSNGPETQGTAPDSTNQLLSSNPQDGQGSRQRGQQLHRREREARMEASGEDGPTKTIMSTRCSHTATQTGGRLKTGGRRFEQRVCGNKSRKTVTAPLLLPKSEARPATEGPRVRKRPRK